MTRVLLAFLAVAACAAAQALAQAPTPAGRVLVLPHAASRDGLAGSIRASETATRQLTRLGAQVVPAELAREKVAEALPLPMALAPTLGPVLADARRAFYYQQRSDLARPLLERVRSTSARCDEFQQATLLLARIEQAMGQTERAKELLRELLHADPTVHVSPADHPPVLRALFEGVRAELAAAPRTTLTVLTRPPGLLVHVGRCKQGPAPLEVADLYPGAYPIWVEGARMRTATARGGGLNVEVDRALDEGLRTAPNLALVGLTGESLASAAASLARLVGADRAALIRDFGEHTEALVIGAENAATLAATTGPANTLTALLSCAAGLGCGTTTHVARKAAGTPWYRRWWVWTLAAAALGGGTAAAVLGRSGSAGPARITVTGNVP